MLPSPPPIVAGKPQRKALNTVFGLIPWAALTKGSKVTEKMTLTSQGSSGLLIKRVQRGAGEKPCANQGIHITPCTRFCAHVAIKSTEHLSPVFLKTSRGGIYISASFICSWYLCPSLLPHSQAEFKANGNVRFMAKCANQVKVASRKSHLKTPGTEQRIY